MKLSTIFIAIVSIIALFVIYRTFQTPKESKVTNFAYESCVAESVSKYDETMKYMKSIEQECRSKGMCNPTDEEWLDAKSEGETKTFDELKKDKEICQIKYQ
jgi:hypothetical protein